MMVSNAHFLDGASRIHFQPTSPGPPSPSRNYCVVARYTVTDDIREHRVL